MLAGLISLSAGQRHAGIGIGAETQVLSYTVDGVVKAPAVGTTLDEQAQVKAVTVTQPLAWITRLDAVDSDITGDQVAGHAGIFRLQELGKCGPCDSSCTKCRKLAEVLAWPAT